MPSLDLIVNDGFNLAVRAFLVVEQAVQFIPPSKLPDVVSDRKEPGANML